jgi:hypothetical protein
LWLSKLTVRGTQSLIHICAFCWKRPKLLGWELLWRWGFGIPAAAILYHQSARIVSGVALNQESLANLSLSDPLAAGQQLTVVAASLMPPSVRAALWLGPLLAVAWAVASGLGRNAVLQRLDPALRPAPLTLILLQLLRNLALVAVCVGWYRAISWAADATLGSAAPNLVAWSAWVICLTLAIFVLWALLSWIFSIAPLLAMLEGIGVFASLSRSLRQGPLTAKLVEVNLVLGIVRLALIVLALVFSAIPLPFEADMTGTALYAWWAVVTLLYLVASDFFQVTRLAAFVQFWRLYHPDSDALRPVDS